MPGFRKVSPGDDLAIPADDYNAAMDAAKYVATQLGGGGGSGEVSRDHATILCENTGSNVDQFGVLGIDTPLFVADDGSVGADELPSFQFRLALSCSKPTKAKHYSKFAIALEPIDSEDTGPVVLAGFAVVQVNVVHASHTHADVTDNDNTKLTTEFSGGAQILWKAPGTGLKWCVVRLGASPRSVLGKADAAIATGASGVVSVWSGTPGSETDTGANVTGVFNRFASLGSGAWLNVLWIDGNPYVAGGGGGSTQRLVKTTTSHAPGTSAAVNLWDNGSGGSEAISTGPVTYTAINRTSVTIPSGKFCLMSEITIGGRVVYYIEPWEC